MISHIVRYCVCVFLISFMLAGCATENTRWQDVTTKQSVNAFESYLRSHPDGQYSSEARERIESLEWENAKRLDSTSGYQAFLWKYPNGQFSLRAEEERRQAVQQEREAVRKRPLKFQGWFDLYYPYMGDPSQPEGLGKKGLLVFSFYEIRYVVSEDHRIKLDELRNLSDLSPGHEVYDGKTCDAVLLTTKAEQSNNVPVG